MMFFPERIAVVVLLMAWTIPSVTDAFMAATNRAASITLVSQSPFLVSSTGLFVGSSDDNQSQEEELIQYSPEASSSGEDTNNEAGPAGEDMNNDASSSREDTKVEVPVPSDVSLAETTSGMDILNSPQFLNRKRDVLLNDLQTIQNDIMLAKERLQQNQNEWGSQLADLSKEYEMIQQRMNVQSNANNDVATSQVVRSMLAVLDNFDRAFGQVTAETEAEVAIENEYKQVYGEILEIFKKLGVEEVPTVGTEFNYEIHQAVLQKPSADFEEGVVCEELQKGFRINNTLIRAAMVAVTM
jgi:molecular chaperone GrpE